VVTVTLSPPIAAVAQPTRAWRATFTVGVKGLAHLRVRPVIEAPVRGTWRPIRLPGLQMPATLTARPAHPATLTLADTGISGARGQLDLALQLVPIAPPGAVGVRVIGTPQASLLLGHAGPIRSTVRLFGLSWLQAGRQLGSATATLADTGHTWLVPAVTEHAGGSTTQGVGNGPILPGQRVVLRLPPPTDPLHWGWNTVRVTAPGAAPVTRTVIAIPAGPLALAGGVGLLVETINLLARRRSSRSAPDAQSQEG
jgi:hypothetical protein